MGMTARALNRATLARQMLLRRERLAVTEAVRRVVGLQAQHPASPYLALWNRLRDFDPADLDRAFTERQVVRATLMRITLHAVHVDDHADLHVAMQPSLRASRLGDDRFTSSGLTAADADPLLKELLEYLVEPRTNAEAEAWIEEQRGVPPKGVWWALRTYAPLLRAPDGGPWSFGPRASYAALHTDVPPTDRAVCDAALQMLVRRYLQGYGPASVADVAQFAMVQRARVRVALEALAEQIEEVAGPDGSTLYDVPGGVRPDEDTPAPPRLLPMWDNSLLAYADRSRMVPPEYRKVVSRMNGDLLPTLLVDGYVAGVWRTVEGGVEATAFHPLPEEVWEGLAEEARTLVGLLESRDPLVWSRYGHWWAKLPDGEVRVLPGP